MEWSRLIKDSFYEGLPHTIESPKPPKSDCNVRMLHQKWTSHSNFSDAKVHILDLGALGSLTIPIRNLFTSENNGRVLMHYLDLHIPEILWVKIEFIMILITVCSLSPWYIAYLNTSGGPPVWVICLNPVHASLKAKAGRAVTCRSSPNWRKSCART